MSGGRRWPLIVLFVLWLLAIGAGAAVARLGLPAWVAALVAAVAAMLTAVQGQRLWSGFRDRATSAADNALATHFVGWTRRGAPRVADIGDPCDLGVTPAADLPGGETGASVPPYVRRTKDDEVRSALRTKDFVLVTGQAKAGKTRTAYEAVRAELAGSLLLAPRPEAGAAAIEALDTVIGTHDLVLPDSVLWLDEVDLIVGDAGLTTARLRRLAGACRGRLVVVATMRSAHWDDFAPETAIGKAGWGVLSRATEIRLKKALNDEERDYAERNVAGGDARVAGALASTSGLAEYLSAVPYLRKRLEAGEEGMPAGAAVVLTAVDCRRAGLRRGISSSVLRQVYVACGNDPGEFDDGLAWATTRVCGTAALLLPDGAGYRPFDQVVEDAENEDTGTHGDPPARFTGHIWPVLAECLTEPEDLAAIGVTAYGAHKESIAEAAFGKAADAGHAGAARNLGHLLAERSDVEAAERWYRRAAEAGDTSAMVALAGRLSEADDARAEAEGWFLRAAEAGDTEAMNELGSLAAYRNAPDDAGQWFRRAAEAGDSGGAIALGNLLDEAGKAGEARDWYRRAADADAGVLISGAETPADPAGPPPDAGEPSDAVVLRDVGAELLDSGGTAADAIAWYRRAADAGDLPAVFRLALLLRAQGESAEAAELLRRAAGETYSRALVNLGTLLRKRGRMDEAEAALGQAGEPGAPGRPSLTQPVVSHYERVRALVTQGRDTSAAYREVLADRRRVLGEDHPMTRATSDKLTRLGE